MHNKDLKIAVIHDHLGFRGGGERTALLLALELKADFITAYAHEDTYPEYQARLGSRLKILTKKNISTRVVRFFWLRNLFRRNRKLFKKYDVLIASSQTATEAVADYSKKQATRIVYTHTTPRRVFDLYEASKKMYPFFLRGAYALFACYWKNRYLRAIRKFDVNIANSKNVRQRIKAHTGGDASLVAWPPIMTDKFRWLEQGDYYLSFGRVDEAKRVSLIVSAFKRLPEKKLIIASGGPRLDSIRKLAKGSPNIKIFGWVTDEELVSLLGNCLATIYIPIDEDAGMSHLESNAAGKPYLGVKEGGLIESTLDNETGILLSPNPAVAELVDGIKKMTPAWCLEKKQICEEYARQFDQKVFYAKLKKVIDENSPKKIILGIDASRWEDPRFPGEHRRTGVEVVACNLIKRLVHEGRKSGIRIRLYTPRTIQSLPISIQKVIPGKKQWTRKCLNQELKNSPVDYFFTPSYYIPKNAPAESFSLIHDVIFRTAPEKYSMKDRLNQEITTWLNAKRSRTIFTVSEFSRREIMREYGIEPKRVKAFKMGHDLFESRGEEAESALREKVIVYIGRIEKKKSVEVLVKAYAKLLESEPEWKLILAGSQGNGYEEIEKLVSENGLEKKIELPGYISEPQKQSLFSRAGLFVHPSSLEGSSLPILEAFHAGIPVVAADVPVMQELAEDAAAYFKPGNAESLCAAMRKIIRQPELGEKMIVRGKQVLKTHSWDKAAKFILENILQYGTNHN